MPRLLLILAGPTPWDVEGRLCGSITLPLTDKAAASIAAVVESDIPGVSAVYRDKTNEACDTAAKIVAKHFNLRPRHNADLAEMNLGLWQGLRREELKFRFPKVFEGWEKNPLHITAPEGESVGDAVIRLRRALAAILLRNRGVTVVVVVRPMALQILSGLLRQESDSIIASHLHNFMPIETIELPDAQVHRFT